MISKATALFGVFLAVSVSIALAKSHAATPAETVVQKLQGLISSGSLLTPEGWKQANNLFDHPSPYPKNSKILVTYPGMVGEWPKGQEAAFGYRDGVVVESKWGSSYGWIDSKLRYQAPEHGSDTPAMEIYHLIYVNHEWKIAGPLLVRSATVDGTIDYVTKMADQSTDLVVKKNAAKTVATLKRLKQGHGNACAC